MTTATLPAPTGTPLRDLACPWCGAHRLHYATTNRRLSCHAAGCVFGVWLTDGEHRDMLGYLAWDAASQPGFVGELARRVHAVPASPTSRLAPCKERGGHKSRIVPTESETPAQRLQRLAEQAAVNEVALTRGIWQGERALYVTSQVTGPGGAPVAIYHITRTSGGMYVCDCPAQGPCAHLAALWADLCRRDGEGNAARARQQVERQFGVREPATQSDTRALAARATADLYGA